MTTQTRTKRYLRTWENQIQMAAESDGIQLFKMPQFSSDLYAPMKILQIIVLSSGLHFFCDDLMQEYRFQIKFEFLPHL